LADETARLGHPEQRMNLCGASYMLTWDILAMGPKRAREMLLLGEVMTAHAAREAGLVNKVVADGALAAAGEDWAERIVRLPRDGIAVGKMATHMALDSLGVSRQFLHGYVAHTIGTNVRFERDEFNFLRERRGSGVTRAIKAREDFHGPGGETD
ncbi:enoyl-CoA hydratase/isomerase family protein, partial [Vineibacter terrae]|uniref:enoyl-CoA hydratase/isomerase family protein n=1 Tax=Vineibacter terrae TaxID=2586908 RepID=UPI002E341168